MCPQKREEGQRAQGSLASSLTLPTPCPNQTPEFPGDMAGRPAVWRAGTSRGLESWGCLLSRMPPEDSPQPRPSLSPESRVAKSPLLTPPGVRWPARQGGARPPLCAGHPFLVPGRPC